MELILGLYDTEFAAFGSMAKDFVRNTIFPRVAEYVPSSTRQGAEAFLKAVRRPRELFEYEDDDLGDLPKIWGGLMMVLSRWHKPLRAPNWR